MRISLVQQTDPLINPRVVAAFRHLLTDHHLYGLRHSTARHLLYVVSTLGVCVG